MVVEWGHEGVNAFLGLPPGSDVLLSTSQLISLLVATGAIALLLTLRRRAPAPTEVPP